MMAQAAIPLDIHLLLLAADADDGAAQVCPDVVVGAPDDPASIREVAARSDVLTFDHELVDPALLAALEAGGVIVRPSAAEMALAQNKRRQRAELGAAGIPVPPFRDVDTLDDLLDFAGEHGWPVIAKAARGGYDGRGVWRLESEAEARALWSDVADRGLKLLVETCLELDQEVAVLVARRPSGETAVYPVVETVQRDGILHELIVPARISNDQRDEAVRIATAIAEQIDAVGILAVELFVSNGKISMNEIAPRPHNSGHWSIEGAVTSQFEQHLRAVLDLPLGATAMTGPAAATVNLLGSPDGSDPRTRLGAGLSVPGAHIHFYGKMARPGRKIGHVTVVAATPDEALARARDAAEQLIGEAGSK